MASASIPSQDSSLGSQSNSARLARRFYRNQQGKADEHKHKMKATFTSKGWDGKISNFQEFKSELEGFYAMNNRSFLFVPEFVKHYLNMGNGVLDLDNDLVPKWFTDYRA